MLIIGLMSGTSVDGIDAALVRIDGAPPSLDWELVTLTHTDYSPQVREAVFKSFRPETGTVDHLCRLNFDLGRAFGDAALHAIEAAGLQPKDIDLIGSHGQTVWHIPDGEGASTLQIGEAALIAEQTGITTISNFRTRDMAVGGQGAPLVSYLDKLLLTHPERSRAAQNIGGIANLTYLPPAGSTHKPLAFDTGPGNMLIDDGIQRITNGEKYFDEDGALADQGQVDTELLETWLADPYYRQLPPKTTGRELFGVQYSAMLWESAQSRGLPPADYLATVTALTAQSIAFACRDLLPTPVDEMIVSGGGARNPVLMDMLAQAAHPTRVLTSDEVGLPGAAKESIAFAVLAYETWHNRPGNLPAVTGAAKPVVLGSITPGIRRAWCSTIDNAGEI
jgi:anhydro-N-acetylmuramic acid kinase